MNVSVPSVLLTLGGKCLLGWALVLLQRRHVFRSFLGVFAVSVAAVDSVLALCFTALHSQDSAWLLGSRMTCYHICLLVQILGRVSDALHWPTVFLAALDHLLTVSQGWRGSRAWGRGLVYLLVTALQWFLALCYVFLVSDFVPVTEDVSHHQIRQCWVTQTSQIQYVVGFLLATLGCFALDAWCRTELLHKASLEDQLANQSAAHSRRHIVHQAARTFLSTWAPFLLLLLTLLPLPVGIPAYLSMNAAWICFLNSLLLALAVCCVRPAEHSANTLPHDSFCEWRTEQDCTQETQV